MSLWVDVKYANMIGPRLSNYKRKSEYLWNYSCNICGDSKRNKLKARGYIYKGKTGLFVKCHNCEYSTNLGNLIKTIDNNLYREYVLENYKESGAPRSHHKDTATAIPDIFRSEPLLVDSVLDSITGLDTLPSEHPAVQYVLNRKLPESTLKLLYIAPKFKKFVNSLLPGKFKDDNDCPRLVIPYFNNHGKCFAFQGRSFGKEEPKYITIKLDDEEERIYGLDRVDYSKKVYIIEGPLDSLFIPNALAVSGSSFSGATVEALKANCTVVYDNEPRSVQLTKLMKKTIEEGFSVCLWPDTITEKDINEMILSGKTSEQIVDIIDNNTSSGAEALLRFATWRKCNENKSRSDD